MKLSKLFEESLQAAMVTAIEDQGPALFEDLIKDNPDWWAEQVKSVFSKQFKKAMNDKDFLKALLIELINDEGGVKDILWDVASEKMEEQLTRDVVVEAARKCLE